jgi:hypothetical protein
MACPFLTEKEIYDPDELMYQEEQMLKIAESILSAAEHDNIIIRLTGSLAIRIQAPEYRYIEYENNRQLNDIDFVIYSRDIIKVQNLFKNLNWQEDQGVLRLFGDKRRIFYSPRENLHADVFIDKLQFCHSIDVRGKLEYPKKTLNSFFLLLGKLQIVEINRKDLIDAILILRKFTPAEQHIPEQMNYHHLVILCSKDWGWWRTVTMNLKKISEYLDEFLSKDEDKKIVSDTITDLQKKIAAQPKSLSWKIRNKLGDKIKWYNEVEEVQR